MSTLRFTRKRRSTIRDGRSKRKLLIRGFRVRPPGGPPPVNFLAIGCYASALVDAHAHPSDHASAVASRAYEGWLNRAAASRPSVVPETTNAKHAPAPTGMSWVPTA